MVEKTIAWRLAKKRRKGWVQEHNKHLANRLVENLALRFGHHFPELIAAPQLLALKENILEARNYRLQYRLMV